MQTSYTPDSSGKDPIPKTPLDTLQMDQVLHQFACHLGHDKGGV